MEAMRGIDIVYHAAALKQVPNCERYPMEAVLTNIAGAENIRRAALAHEVRLVVSVESDQEWADKVLAANPDPRLELVVVSEPFEDKLVNMNLADYDLIFVDHAIDPVTRARTIEYLARNVTTSRVVIHDYENQEYRDAARGFAHKLLDCFRTPHTAMVWK